MTEETPKDSDVHAAVKERLEFFFSDANLRQDKFLRNLVLEGDGTVPVETLLKFNTIKKHTTDPQALVNAAKELNTLKVSEDDKTVSRVDPFTKELMEANVPLTLHIDNLPVKDHKYECTADEIREAFSKFGKVNLVKLLFAGKSRRAVGGAYVEFAEKSAADAAIAECSIPEGEEAAKKPLEIKGNSLVVVSLTAFRERKRKDHDDNKEDAEVELFSVDWKPGCVLRLEGLSEDCDRETLLDAVGEGLELTQEQIKEQKIYADYSRGQKDGAIRFNEPSDQIKTLFDKLKSGELKIKDKGLEAFKILEGDEEKEYWTSFIDFKNKKLKLRADKSRSTNKRRKYR